MRPPAPTKIECKHGRDLITGTVWEKGLCICCGNTHRSIGHLCLKCRPSMYEKPGRKHG